MGKGIPLNDQASSRGSMSAGQCFTFQSTVPCSGLPACPACLGQTCFLEDRIPWLCNLHDILLRDVASGQHVVLACSALKKMYRDILTQGKDGAALKCEESGKEAERAEMQLLVVHLSGSFEVISGRLLKRKGHFMPSELLQSQFETLEPPAAPENFIQISVDKNVSEIIAKIMETLKMK
nr:probable gluconokinase isoform X9 [Chlorocebus sabaeus]XP_037854483.1 probable gluconokinase isoform X9 [Chlorocebus sabaeus]